MKSADNLFDKHRHALAQSRWQSFHLAGEAVERGLGPIAIHFAQNDKARLAFNQRPDRGAIERALDQITFPVAWYQSCFDLFRAIDNA
jgi:hypothetical protein